MPAQVVLTIGGLWLMAAPAVLGYGDAAAVSDRSAGPVMAAIAFLSIFTITRGLRWLNLPVGLWLVVAPWLLGFPADATVSSTVVGVAALALAWVGRVDQSRYGGGWRTLFHPDRLPSEE
ncbi:MAG TPA: SPW repeat protein [Nocardioidaceae bacterium]|nr:SPW repeat protein [Nocardioidaceae bacterium]